MTILENTLMEKRDALKYAELKGIILTINELDTALQTPSRNAYCVPGKPEMFLKFFPQGNGCQVITARIGRDVDRESHKKTSRTPHARRRSQTF